MLAPSLSRVLLVLLAAASLAAPALAQSLETREQELSQIREQIERLREKVGAIRSRESSLSDRLERVTVELDLQQARLDEAESALLLATERTGEAEDEIASLEASLLEVRSDLRRRLVGLYRLGRHGYVRLFLSMKPGEDLLSAFRQLRYLVQRDRRALDRYDALLDEKAAQQRVLERERLQIAQWQGEEQERRDQLLEVRKRRQRLLEQVSAERRVLDAQAGELEAKEQKLSRFVLGLAADGPEPLGGVPIQDFKGVLDWPIQGEVTLEFGPQRDPRYRTETPHNGVDLATEMGSKVRAVYAGEVIYAAEFEGYGPMVVLHHAGQVFTLYAGLRLLNVEKGEVLSVGDVLGASGELLYFEVRVESQAQNPRDWLR
ncbi:MAG: peptidoglycan DD-metalloendopeptidase family protein [Acidobacteriota bacterium]